MAAVLVIAGLCVAMLASALTGSGQDPLPAVALGSNHLLLVERAMAFFAAWMVCLVVIAEALRGRLPTELSSGGVRYADAEAVDTAKVDTAATTRDILSELERLDKTVALVEADIRRLQEVD